VDELFQTPVMNKKIGLLSLGAGRNAGGPEVYEHNIVVLRHFQWMLAKRTDISIKE